jgi:hypothetical protein
VSESAPMGAPDGASLREDLMTIAMGLGLAGFAWWGCFGGFEPALNLVRFYVWAVLLPTGFLGLTAHMAKSAAKHAPAGLLARLLNRGCAVLALFFLVYAGHIVTAAALLLVLLLMAVHLALAAKFREEMHRG